MYDGAWLDIVLSTKAALSVKVVRDGSSVGLERYSDKVEVGGSIPLRPTKPKRLP